MQFIIIFKNKYATNIRFRIFSAISKLTIQLERCICVNYCQQDSNREGCENLPNAVFMRFTKADLRCCKAANDEQMKRGTTSKPDPIAKI